MKLIITLSIILLAYSCAINKKVYYNKCIELDSNDLNKELCKKFSLDNYDSKKYMYKPYLFIDSICAGIITISYHHKNNTRTIIPVLKCLSGFFIHTVNDKHKNLLNFNEFKKQLTNNFSEDEYNRIRDRFLIGILKEAEI